MKKILVSGSLAYDRIMVFPGRFSEHILPDKIHTLNVSFGIESLKENFGGTAGNISYNLALLEEQPFILSSTGKDFLSYEHWLKEHKIDLSGVIIHKDLPTASAYIITDTADNQITAFHMGATKVSLKEIPDDLLCGAHIAIIAPGNKEDMIQLSNTYARMGLRAIFDPGQALLSFDLEGLQECIFRSWILIANDYEVSYIVEKTGLSKKEILSHIDALITTLGEKGSIIETKEKIYEIPPAKPMNTCDPTGAGDAYRAGLIKGIVSGLPWDVSGKLGSVVSVYTVEKYGTQTHHFTLDDIKKRYEENYKEVLKLSS